MIVLFSAVEIDNLIDYHKKNSAPLTFELTVNDLYEKPKDLVLPIVGGVTLNKPTAAGTHWLLSTLCCYSFFHARGYL